MDGRRDIEIDIGNLEKILNYSDLNKCILIFSADSYAWCKDWGSAFENMRGRKLKEFFEEKNLVTANNDGDPNYNAGTCNDITFMRESDNRIIYWRLKNETVSSDHYMISFDLEIYR